MHTGDWKIDEDPVDGLGFDREALEQVGECLNNCSVVYLLKCLVNLTSTNSYYMHR